MGLQPLSNRVLVLRTESDSMSAGGIIIPDTAKEKPLQARVVSVGPGKVGSNGERIATSVSAGDLVLFGRYAGDEVRIDGTDHMILRDDEILAVIEE
jgi:chaperonin GroES